MYEKLTNLIGEGDFKEALYEFQDEYLHIDEKNNIDAAKLCVLEATIWEALGDDTAEFDAIARGIAYDGSNYELFYMLGLYYRDINVNKAYLCMEMALYYYDNADDSGGGDDRAVLGDELLHLIELFGVDVAVGELLELLHVAALDAVSVNVVIDSAAAAHGYAAGGDAREE